MPFLSLFCIYITTFFFSTYLHRWWDICWKSMACQQMACDNDLWCYFLPFVLWPNPIFKVQFRADWNTQIPARARAVDLVFTLLWKGSIFSPNHFLLLSISECAENSIRKNPRCSTARFFKTSTTFSSFCPPPHLRYPQNILHFHRHRSASSHFSSGSCWSVCVEDVCWGASNR